MKNYKKFEWVDEMSSRNFYYKAEVEIIFTIINFRFSSFRTLVEKIEKKNRVIKWGALEWL